jgi:hypothetical protein
MNAQRLSGLILALLMLTGCASYQPPPLPVDATAEEREWHVRCHAQAADWAAQDVGPKAWHEWLPRPTTPESIAAAPITYPLGFWLLKRAREARFAVEYRDCMRRERRLADH